jgi:hypothetical protein
VDLSKHFVSGDVFDTHYDTAAMLLTIRGQVWVVPVLKDDMGSLPYQSAGQNLPARRYRVLPGAMTGGAMRVLKALHVPLYYSTDEDPSATTKERLTVILATDPLSLTAEQAFYLLNVQDDDINSFADLGNLPKPFLGGHVNGGSSQEGGLQPTLKL